MSKYFGTAEKKELN